MNCHQGRESGGSVQALIERALHGAEA